MAGADATALDGPETLERGWQALVRTWAARRRLVPEVDESAILVRAGALTVRFMATRELLVVFMTDGRALRPDQLGSAAAAANAWNTEQLIPMLSVWDVHGPDPCLAGVCSLPLTLRIGPPEFAVLADGWAARGDRMFDQSRRVLEVLK